MGDDLGKKVQQIAQLLGQDNVPDNVKELISLIAASTENKSDKGDVSSQETQGTQGTQGDVSSQTNKASQSSAAQISENIKPAFNKEVISTARNALTQFNSSNDPRINLLNAIKPFMNNRRQKKIGNCIQLLQIAGLSRLLNEQEK